MTYKRKWFLRLEGFRLPMTRSVATYAAMKSGLKGHLLDGDQVIASGSNLCRDEKRTESLVEVTVAPMHIGSNLCRDEKRTERKQYRLRVERPPSSNLCRDEKRTERE